MNLYLNKGFNNSVYEYVDDECYKDVCMGRLW